MESGINDLEHQIQNQFNSYDSQAEESEQDDINMCSATGSKDRAEIIDDCQHVSSKKKRKQNSGEAENSATETKQTKTRSVIDKLTNSLQLAGNTGLSIN